MGTPERDKSKIIPIRHEIRIEEPSLNEGQPSIEKFAKTLVNLTKTIMDLSTTGDGEKVTQGIEQVISDSGISKENQEMASMGFTIFANAFFYKEQPHIIRKPNLRIIPKDIPQEGA